MGAAAVSAGVAVVVAFAAAVHYLPQPSEPDAARTAPEAADAASVTKKNDLSAAIRAAASTAGNHRRVTSVDCVKPVDTTKTLLVSCAVTFDGPACQLWLAGGLDDPEPTPVGEPTEGRRGRASTRMAYCDEASDGG